MKTSRLAIDIIAIMASILVVFFSSTALTELSNSNYKYISSLTSNWVKNLIFNVYEYDSNNECIPLINDFWKGTKNGCYCKFNLFGNGLKSYSCDSDDSSCYTIDSTPPVYYKNWQNTTICAEYRPISYFDLTIVRNTDSCANGYKTCGIIDTYNNKLCVEDHKNCPVVGLKILDTHLYDKDEYVDWRNILLKNDKILLFKTDDKFLNMSLNSTDSANTNEPISDINKYMQINNEKASKKIKRNKIFNNPDNKNREMEKIRVQFRVEEDTPCLISTTYNTKGSLYLLDSRLDYPQCELYNNNYYDESYEKIDTINNLKLLDSNKILNLLTDLPEFDQKLYDYDINLYYKTYVGVDFRCFRELSATLTKDELFKYRNIQDNYETEIVLVIITLVLSIILIIILLAVFFIEISNDYNIDDIHKLSSSFGIFFIGICILGVSLGLNLYHQETIERQTLLESENCVDLNTVFAFTSFHNNFNLIKSDYLGIFLLSLVLTSYRFIFYNFYYFN